MIYRLKNVCALGEFLVNFRVNAWTSPDEGPIVATVRIYFAILISIFVHLCLEMGIGWLPVPPGNQIGEVIEVDLQEDALKNKNPKMQQFVRDSLLPEHLKHMDEATLAKYLSAQNQRVKKEMKAANSGMTQNRSQSAAQQQQQLPMPANPKMQKDPELKDEPANEDDILVAKKKKQQDDFAKEVAASQQNQRTLPNLPSGQSTLGEHLPETLSIGSFTALNTDRFTYYTFYARVEELVRFRWETKVRQALQTLDRVNLLNQVRGKNWVTYYEFWIEPSGKLHSAHLMKESGVKRFDLAAEFAFRDALVFPNPPKDLIDEDGYIKLRYTFNVFWNGQQ